MQLFSNNRNRLRDTMVFQAPEVNPHAFVQRLLAREQAADVSYLGGVDVSICGPVTGRTYHFATGAALRIDRRDADVLTLLPHFKRLSTG